MRVVHLIAGNMYGGVETYLLTLVKGQHFCPEMETHIAVCYEGRLSEELAAMRAPVHVLSPVRLSHPWTIRQVRPRLRDLLVQGDFDVAVCHMAWTQIVFGPAIRAAKRRNVMFLHSPLEKLRWLERWARLTPPDLLLCVSQDTARTGKRIYPSVSAQVVYSPMPEFDASTEVDVRPAVRRELQTPANATVFLQASRMEAWKGHPFLLEALGRLRHQDGWVCWIAGGPQNTTEKRYFESLELQAARQGITGRIRFLGQRRDVRRLMAASDVFCQANTGGEGFSYAFMEACSASLPIVTSDIGGAPEIVDSTNGFLIAPRDVSGFANALGKFIGNPELCRTMGAAGNQRVHAMCDRSRQIRRLHEIMSPLVNEPAAAMPEQQ